MKAGWQRWLRTGIRYLGLGALPIMTGCREVHHQELTLQVGPAEVLRFAPASGYAQYFEIPGRGDILRLVFASYPLTCPKFETPARGEVYLSVTVQAESGETLVGRKIPWEGIPSSHGTEADSNAADSDSPPPVWALPMIRLFEDARPLPPGGFVTLNALSREAYGVVEGEFHFSDAGEGEAASAALMGPFRLQLCHAELDATRMDQVETATEPSKPH